MSRESRAKERIDYLREQVINENISYSEIAELQSLVEFIEPSDTQMLEWAGAPERAMGLFKAQRKVEKALKAVKRAKKAMVAYYDGDTGLENYVDNCFEGEAVRILNQQIQHLQELWGVLTYIEHHAPYNPDHCPESSDGMHEVLNGSCDLCGANKINNG